MATWGSRGLRGSQLEEIVNSVNEKYRDLNLALIQKIPTPITPVRMDNDRHITLAYFDKTSTVDFIGVVQGYPVCFDAKECSLDTFALSNVHEHQYLFMRDFEKQQGISFILIYFTKRNQYYYMRFSEIDSFYQRALGGGPKSIKYSELNPAYFMGPKSGILVHYLEGILMDLNERNLRGENDI